MAWRCLWCGVAGYELLYKTIAAAFPLGEPFNCSAGWRDITDGREAEAAES